MDNVSSSTKKLAHMSILLAMALVLSTVEHMLPPIPFAPPSVRLGLANIVTMYTLFYMNWRSAVMLAVLKAFFVMLMRGSVTAGVLSLAGGLCSVFAMLLLAAIFKDKISYLILSVVGATAHNFAQIAVASMIVKSNLMMLYWPVLLISGVLFGTVTGIALRSVMPYFSKIFKNGYTK
jgi:Predicted membrane protein